MPYFYATDCKIGINQDFELKKEDLYKMVLLIPFNALKRLGNFYIKK